MFLSLIKHVATALALFTIATLIIAVSCRLCPAIIFDPFMFDCKETIKEAIGGRTDTASRGYALLPSASMMANSSYCTGMCIYI